ncbi:single-stranded DNA-binding protein [Solimonas sp. C16B3]|uniref:Single-stranded DNA-binding protein n=2 Tax=Solimonas marina TaxID=2714601 RepID=A0A969W8P9_9GAMM|nr:single-stranded DNA-binding protein [Solimonas marina]
MKPIRTVKASAFLPAELLRAAVEKGHPLETIEKFMALQERWEAQQAKKAFHAAMAKFRAQHVPVLRSQAVEQGPLRGTAYAKLSDFVNAATPALSAADLSVTWKILRDEPAWIEVACVITHADGHSEQVSMGGPPDVGGAKNAIQARASTVSYLEKYTFKMATGLAEQDDDDDGNGGRDNPRAEPQPERQRADAKPEKPEYDAAAFKANLPAWEKLVQNSEKTPAQIIARVGLKATLTEEQRKAIHALAKPKENINA